MLTKCLLGTVYQRAYSVEDSWAGRPPGAIISTSLDFHISALLFEDSQRWDLD